MRYNPADAMEKIRVASTSDFGERAQKYVTLNGKQLYVSRVGERYYTADSKCPCPLSGGTLNRVVAVESAPCVECDARCYTLSFDLRTGRNTHGAPEVVDCYPTTVENGEILVDPEPISRDD